MGKIWTWGAIARSRAIVSNRYRGVVKDHFARYYLHASNVTLDRVRSEMYVYQNHAEPWRGTLIETGPKTVTGGRLKRVRETT